MTDHDLIERLEGRSLYSAGVVVDRPVLRVGLVDQTVGVETSGVDYALKGDGVGVSLDITNAGAKAARGDVTAEFFVSASRGGMGAKKIFETEEAIAIEPGAWQAVGAEFSIPRAGDLAVGKTYTLVVRLIDRSAGERQSVTVDGDAFKLLPEVVNVITPGFLSDQPGGYATWNKVASELDRAIPAGSSLAGDVVGFVEKWPSTAGFLQELEGIAAQAIAPTVSTFEAALLQSEGATLIASGKLIAARNAEAAAEDVVAKLTDPRSRYYVDPALAARGDNPQVIQLIGHSRGAAVNAAVALGLGNMGYLIADYISLDGYSTDWPGLSGEAGDISITSDIEDAGTHVENAMNYQVQSGIASSLSSVLYKSASKYLTALDLPASSFASALDVFADAKAPDRPEPIFANIVIQGLGKDAVSDHVNIGDIYADSDPMLRKRAGSVPSGEEYILDNYEGEHLG